MLYISDNLNVDHRAYVTEGNARRTLQVGMVALDDYFKPGERVDLLKLDIQGYELHALQGAKRIVNENREIKVKGEHKDSAFSTGYEKIQVIAKPLFEILDVPGKARPIAVINYYVPPPRSGISLFVLNSIFRI